MLLGQLAVMEIGNEANEKWQRRWNHKSIVEPQIFSYSYSSHIGWQQNMLLHCKWQSMCSPPPYTIYGHSTISMTLPHANYSAKKINGLCYRVTLHTSEHPQSVWDPLLYVAGMLEWSASVYSYRNAGDKIKVTTCTATHTVAIVQVMELELNANGLTLLKT